MSKKRLRVECGKYKVGDIIHDKIISEFGKSWEQKALEDGELSGQLWEECRCGREPIYMSHDLCEICANRFHGKNKKFCYAYFQEEAVVKPSIYEE